MDPSEEQAVMRPIKSVQLDALAYLKIISLCQSPTATTATGQLVGLEEESILEISNCFQIPSDTPDSFAYALSMLRSLRDVNLDHEAVGWFCTSLLGSLYSENIIETQFNFQQNIAQSVMLVYDPVLSSGGNISISAYRLSDKFMGLYKDKRFTSESLGQAGLSSADIYEQLPITVKSTTYASLLVKQLAADLGVSVYDHLKMGTTSVIEKNAEALGECLDNFAQEQYKINRYYQQVVRQQQLINHHTNKRKAENQKRIAAGEEPVEEDLTASFRTIAEPSRLEGLLLEAQIKQQAKTITASSAVLETKASFVKSIQ